MAINPPHTVDVVRAPLVANRYGNEQVRDWDHAVDVKTGVPAWVQPEQGTGISGSETVVGGERVVTRRVAYVFDTVQILATDALRFEGVIWPVAGPPEVWTDNTLANQMVPLKRVTG